MTNPPEAQPADIHFDDKDPRVAWHRVWFNLQRIQRSMGPRIARELKQAGIADPIWYEILLEVERAGETGILMSMLEKKLFLPQYALSRHISRIAEAGLVRRQSEPGQGRSQRLFLTDTGRGLHRRIWDIYGTAIRAELSHRLTTDEAYALNRVLIRLYP
ncbi:MarR family winged helix-turn-helix transcriptional regulator [Qingshengfaniella alkalisoli]|uniref:MarR family transcriptional regulator n=1 Tax=Qingshengfaniella alkalisoli TaxID=2599296 RepID=A0A5B8IUU2_9RHOB|nr:MarR family transcriptional regulator [Qingshengfaniella alkalisoli]QDY68228.1 MarR family transcriptional regulator [Qingshengfaniella alkalisoli]